MNRHGRSLSLPKRVTSTSRTCAWPTLAACALAPLLVPVAGCGSQATVPKELGEARSAYSVAAQGPAATYDPADLQVARKSLDRAEEWYRVDAKASESKTQAYLATRRAQTADAQGKAALAMAQGAQAQRALLHIQSQALAAQQAELDRVRGELTEEQASRNAAEQRAMAVLERQGRVRDTSAGKVVVLPGAVLF